MAGDWQIHRRLISVECKLPASSCKTRTGRNPRQDPAADNGTKPASQGYNCTKGTAAGV